MDQDDPETDFSGSDLTEREFVLAIVQAWNVPGVDPDDAYRMATRGVPEGVDRRRWVEATAKNLLLEQLYREHLPAVRKLLERLAGPVTDTKDAAQETFIRIPQRAPGIKPPKDPGTSWRGFLCGVAYRVWCEHRRSAARRREQSDAELPDATSRTPTPEEAVGRMQDEEIYRGLLQKLDSESRAMILLAQSGLHLSEIARHMNLEYHQVRYRYEKAIERLAAAYRRLR